MTVINKFRILALLLLILSQVAPSQKIVRVSNLLPQGSSMLSRGVLSIYHDAAGDTLISRHIEANRLAGAIDGYRIQVYRRGARNAGEEADKIMAQVIVDFPELRPYKEFESPNYYIVRIGDFRTKIEATRLLARVRRSFPDCYLVKQKINLPETTR
jgi:hypothetical protein